MIIYFTTNNNSIFDVQSKLVSISYTFAKLRGKKSCTSMTSRFLIMCPCWNNYFNLKILKCEQLLLKTIWPALDQLNMPVTIDKGDLFEKLGPNLRKWFERKVLIFTQLINKNVSNFNRSLNIKATLRNRWWNVQKKPKRELSQFTCFPEISWI